MDMLADPQGTPYGDPNSGPMDASSDTADIAGALASRIGDLYAAEERQRRAARTELMIARALEHE